MTEKDRTNWIRYCVPRGSQVHYDAEGFPWRPNEQRFLQPAAVELTSVLTAPCVVLVGEPGIGKSDAIRQMVAATRGFAEEPLFVDLADDGDPAETIYDTEGFRGWETGRPLDLFLDSLDENPRVLRGLLSRLRRSGNMERLRLRITCRTGEVPELLNRELPGLWGDSSHVQGYELMPLCREDIALHVGDDADSFLECVIHRGAAPLAIRPVCLKFLWQQFRECKDLPDTRWKLYEDGCRHLCKENNPARNLPELRGAFDSHTRMDVAARIAAVGILTGRGLVQRAIDRDDLPAGVVKWREVVDDAINAEAVRETLHGTSLFCERGEWCLGFAHASYAGFLAARYVRTRGLHLADLVELCVGPGYRGPIPLAIRDVAGWLASEDPETQQWLLEHDARVLVRSDLGQVEDDLRVALVTRLLELMESRTLPVYDLHAHYRKLRHPGLAAQLEPWLTDGARDVLARTMAAEIAGACECMALAPVLVRIVLAGEEPALLRSRAFTVLWRMSEPSTLRELLPLLLDPRRAPDAYLRGRLVRSLWPHHLSEDELFAALDAVHGRSGSPVDDLDGFIERTLVPTASDALVARMFDRLRSDVATSGERRSKRLLGELLVSRALESLDQPEVLAALARYVALCLARHSDPFWSSQGGTRRRTLSTLDQVRRRRLAQAVFDDAAPEVGDRPIHPAGLVNEEDTAWMIQRWLEAPSAAAQARWLRLVVGMVREHPPAAGSEAEELLGVVAERSAEFKRALVWWFGPVEWGRGSESKLASEMRAEYEHRRRADAEREAHERQRLAAEEEVRTRLSRLIADIRAAAPEPGDIEDLMHRLRYFEDDAQGYPEDVLKMKVWEVLPADSRDQLRAVVAEFLVRHPLVEHESWRMERTCRLLRFVAEVDPAWPMRQSLSLWREWVPALVRQLDFEDETHAALLRGAYDRLRDYVRWCFAVLVTRVDGAELFQRVRAAAERVLARDTPAFMADRLADDEQPAKAYGALLAYLLGAGWPGVEARLHHLIAAGLDDPRMRARAREAGVILWEHRPDFGWPVLGPRFAADPSFGEEIVECIAQRHWPLQGSAWDNRHEDAIAEVYVWMVERFPEAGDPELGPRFAEVARYKIGQLRHSLLVNLQSRGTPESLERLSALKQQLPGERSLSYAVGHARDSVAGKAWKWLSPRQVVYLQRRRKGLPQLDSVLSRLSIAELRRIAGAIDPELAASLPEAAAKAGVVLQVADGIRRRKALTPACRLIRQVLQEEDDELARLLEPEA